MGSGKSMVSHYGGQPWDPLNMPLSCESCTAYMSYIINQKHNQTCMTRSVLSCCFVLTLSRLNLCDWRCSISISVMDHRIRLLGSFCAHSPFDYRCVPHAELYRERSKICTFRAKAAGRTGRG